MGVSGPRHARPRFTPGKEPPVLTVQEAGWAPEPVWTQRLEEKSFAPAGNRTSIARSSSLYPDIILTELPASPTLIVSLIIIVDASQNMKWTYRV
jgi:hypothetical protein